MKENNYRELRLKSGHSILGYIKQFSSTEKAVFGIFVVGLIFTAVSMAYNINNIFLTSVPAKGGELREGVVGLPRTISPVLAVTEVDKDLTSLIYSGLMRYKHGELVPDLAESYSISEDGLVYTFKLKKDLHFQDGVELTSEDVAFTIQKIQDPSLKSIRRADWADVTVKVISSNEISFTLKKPYSPFLSNTTVGIIPKHIWSNVSNDQFIFSQFNIEPIGAGPYKLQSIERDSGGIPTVYELNTWNKYHGQEPYITEIYFLFFSNEEKALDALDSGTIDSLSAISPGPAAKLSTDTAQPYTIKSTVLPRIFGVFFNQNRNALLADKNIRQALDMAINRQQIIDSVLSGYGSPIYSPILSNHGTYDPAKAMQILEKNNWKKDANGVYVKKSGKNSTTTLAFELYTSDSTDLKSAAEIIKEQLEKFGVLVTIKTFPSNDLYQNVIRTREYDALLFGEQLGKDRDLYAFWHSSQRNSPGLNVSVYANSKADKILEEIRTISSSTIRQIKYTELDQIIRADMPAIFLYSPEFIYAIPRSLKGFEINSMSNPTDRWNDIDNWYLETEKIWKIFTYL